MNYARIANFLNFAFKNTLFTEKLVFVLKLQFREVDN